MRWVLRSGPAGQALPDARGPLRQAGSEQHAQGRPGDDVGKSQAAFWGPASLSAAVPHSRLLYLIPVCCT